ncbi:MAG: glycosyl transferase [Candidatus Handelsmanbacteria bacterium RIFCSPLOWO2_12_FULL_64_10]|uniref:Glycosyl transferase n=1 Tax=Handelsmanbacteria sp. (strain RIFCSPLOWO2_12_FULL_64_10) TaxID=1817868 RepID=A0A1F6C3E6_HANXR|nr:MAG: glycosyl transferase [Candidatus Handelsmanbacteria bacterium RIFCSPLOWO2_12_FULL_64_10]
MSTSDLRAYHDAVAAERDRRKRRNRYYHQEVRRLYAFLIPPGSSVLEVGCDTGDLLASVRPSFGVGIDFSRSAIKIAQSRYPYLHFIVSEAECLSVRGTFDYVILSGLLGEVSDIQGVLEQLQGVTRPDTRIIVDQYNYLWEPLLRFGEAVGLKTPQRIQNWLPLEDIANLLFLAGYEVIRRSYRFLLPKKVPLIALFVNRCLARLPFVRKLCLVQFIVARNAKGATISEGYSCSVVIPCRNERGNIEGAVARTPEMGGRTELIFVDGNSTDGTVEEIQRVMRDFPDRDVKLIHQGEGKGKGDAVRKGFAAATGDVLMILDADLTVPPEDLPRFYRTLAEGKGEFINGSRLVYPMEQKAMRALNLLGNKFFSQVFTWLLEQRIRDTLCGTKVLFRRDYLRIARGRSFFGDFDPFGDFDLLFGAAKLNLKIVEAPVHYRERTYGATNISRFRHGWLLLKMSWLAFRKLKLN